MSTANIAGATGKWLNQFFTPSTRGSSHRIEFIAGLTTFVTMAYIIFVNTSIMSISGLNPTALTIGTILAAAIPTIIMGLWADLPWALAPGMGYNVLFAVTVVGQKHFPVGAALALVFLDGVAFTLIAIGPWREQIIMGIPKSLKLAAGAGIGLFIAFIGMVNSGMIVFAGGEPRFVGFGTPGAIIVLVGLVLTFVLMTFRVKGALFLSILGTTIIAYIAGNLDSGIMKALNLHNPSQVNDFVRAPEFGIFFEKGFGAMNFTPLFDGSIAVSVIILFFLTFLITDMMDSLGTFSGLASKLGLLDEKGNFPRSGRALIVDAVAGMWGPINGTSTVATYIESASGVGEGGKTGIASLWVAFFFLLSLFFVPFVGLVPSVATAPVLIAVGYLMIEPIVQINFSEMTEGIPAFLALLAMPVTYSIADGMFLGIVSYVILKLVTGKVKDIHWVMWAFAILMLGSRILDAGVMDWITSFFK
jgi:AGZA family xanthine/uracil permease-like MFS transporter